MSIPNYNQVVATQLEGEHPEPEAISDDKAKALREQMAKMVVSKDVEHIKHLMANYHNASIETKLVILEDLDYYMHQVHRENGNSIYMIFPNIFFFLQSADFFRLTTQETLLVCEDLKPS